MYQEVSESIWGSLEVSMSIWMFPKALSKDIGKYQEISGGILKYANESIRRYLEQRYLEVCRGIWKYPKEGIGKYQDVSGGF